MHSSALNNKNTIEKKPVPESIMNSYVDILLPNSYTISAPKWSTTNLLGYNLNKKNGSLENN